MSDVPSSQESGCQDFALPSPAGNEARGGAGEQRSPRFPDPVFNELAARLFATVRAELACHMVPSAATLLAMDITKEVLACLDDE